MKRTVCFLLTEDGTVFPGRSFGYPAPTVDELTASDLTRGAGEVVFNTGMCGYYEILTDPSYTGQIVSMTYPLIGNYGTDEAWSETLEGARKAGELVKASGLVVRSLYDGPLPPGRKSLESFLKENRTPGICDVDTRALTLKIREEGMPRGVILRSRHKEDAPELFADELEEGMAFLKAFPEMSGRNLIAGQEVPAPEVHNPEGSPHFALVDCGTKTNILRQMVREGCRVTVCPHTMSAPEILAVKPDAVLISNGPGDPAVLTDTIATVKALLGKIPLFGICLGHQLIGLALEAGTEKMKFGHHGVNNPVRDERTGRVFVTSQNHGFMVREKTLPAGTEVWFRNANDGTVEGLRDDARCMASAQFHPESAPGPEDTFWIFREFLNMQSRGIQ